MENGIQQVQETAARAAEAGWFRMAHVLGAVVYLGGSFTASRLLGLLAKSGDSVRSAAAGMGRRVYLTLTLPAGLLLVGTGLYMAIADPDGVGYWKKPWFHMKLTLAVLIVMVDHLLVMRPLKALAKGGADPKSQEGLYRAGFWLLALLSFALLMALFVIRK
jgi:uncharacterized membrane protein